MDESVTTAETTVSIPTKCSHGKDDDQCALNMTW